MSQININKAREVYYGLFSSLFNLLQNEEVYSKIITTVEILEKNSLDEYSETALKDMKIFLEENNFDYLKSEINQVFYSPSTSFIPVTASFYDEARDDGKKRLEMLSLVSLSTFRRDDNFKETEDSIAFIFTFMNKLLNDEVINNKNSENISKKVFIDILNPIIDEFIQKLYDHECSVFYKDLSIVLKVFMEFERHFYEVKKPVKNSVEEAIKYNTKVKSEAKKRPVRNFKEFKTV